VLSTSTTYAYSFMAPSQLRLVRADYLLLLLGQKCATITLVANMFAVLLGSTLNMHEQEYTVYAL
jgi:hypothetical protein